MSMTLDIKAAVADALKSIGSDGPAVEVEMKLSGGAADLLAHLAGELHRDRGRTISEALALLFYGLTIQKEGMHMAVVDREGNVQSVLDLFPEG